MMLVLLVLLLLLLVIYTYLGYPYIIYTMARKEAPLPATGRSPSFDPAFHPHVTIVFAAYNEEAVMNDKLINHMHLDYPTDKLEVLVATDLCSDNTNRIVREMQKSYSNIVLVEGTERKGKCATINNAISKANGEILVFTDANTMFDSQAIKELVKYFHDPQTGLVCGELELESPNDNIGGKGESLYWKYETAIKRWSGKLGSIVGATGGIYAIRRAAFEPFPVNKLIMDDFWLAMRIRLKGYKAYYAETAIAREKTSFSIQEEWNRKVRIGHANYNVIPMLMEALDFMKHRWLAFQYFSYKILRWFVPHMAILLLFLTIVGAGRSKFCSVLLFLQLVFYLLSLLGKKLKIFYPLTYFLVMNSALLVGFIRFLKSSQPLVWTPPMR